MQSRYKLVNLVSSRKIFRHITYYVLVQAEISSLTIGLGSTSKFGMILSMEHLIILASDY